MIYCLDCAESAPMLSRALAKSLEEPELTIDAGLARIFLISDILHNSVLSSSRGATRYRSTLQELLPGACEQFGFWLRGKGRMAQRERERVLRLCHFERFWHSADPARRQRAGIRSPGEGEKACVQKEWDGESLSEDDQVDADGESFSEAVQAAWPVLGLTEWPLGIGMDPGDYFFFLKWKKGDLKPSVRFARTETCKLMKSCDLGVEDTLLRELGEKKNDRTNDRPKDRTIQPDD
ncbi:unnamed protein product [Symbiodinium microadriaticum]|nr:unnamed protein product [Symbiodinium microadriaticum]